MFKSLTPRQGAPTMAIASTSAAAKSGNMHAAKHDDTGQHQVESTG